MYSSTYYYYIRSKNLLNHATCAKNTFSGLKKIELNWPLFQNCEIGIYINYLPKKI